MKTQHLENPGIIHKKLSFGKWKKKYLPEQAEQEEYENLRNNNPEELGRKLARKMIKELFQQA